MSANLKRITVDREVATAIQRLAFGNFRGGEVHPNGDVTFEIDDEGADWSATASRATMNPPCLRRLLKERGGIDLPPKKPN